MSLIKQKLQIEQTEALEYFMKMPKRNTMTDRQVLEMNTQYENLKQKTLKME